MGVLGEGGWEFTLIGASPLQSWSLWDYFGFQVILEHSFINVIIHNVNRIVFQNLFSYLYLYDLYVGLCGKNSD